MKMTEKESDEKETRFILEPLTPYRGNLVLSFLVDRLHLGVPGIVVTAFITLSLFNILLNFLQETLLPTPGLYALLSLHWATHWTNVPFLYPLLAGVVFVVYRRIPFMFRDLIDSGVLVPQRDQRSFFADLQKRCQSRIVNIAIVIGLIGFAIGWAIVKTQQNFADWTHVVSGCQTVASWYFIFIGTIGVYVLLHFAFTIFVTFQAIHTVFVDPSRFKISLKFMHPDRCCGLRPLSKFVLRIGLLLAVLGFVNGVYIATSFYRLGTVIELLQQIGPILSIAGYVIIAPLLFFLPLLPAHRVMRDSKHRFQLQISREFDRRFRDVSHRMANGKLDPTEHTQLEVLNSFQRYVDAFPVWPFDISTLGKFASMVLLPVVLTIVGILLQKLFLP